MEEMQYTCSRGKSGITGWNQPRPRTAAIFMQSFSSFTAVI